MSTGGRIVRLAAAGVAVAGALAIRRAVQRAARDPRPEIVDWPLAETLAIRRLSRSDGALAPSEVDAASDAWRTSLDAAVAALEQRLGAPMPPVVARHATVARAGWVRANVATFRALGERLEAELERPFPSTPGLAAMAAVNRALATRQVAFVLAWLATRVLGQYDVALLSAEETPGRLLFVEENVRAVSRDLSIPLADLRTWIALHEATHAWEMEAHPWVRPWLRDRLERQLSLLVRELRAVGRGDLRAIVARVGGGSGAGLLGVFLGPEQQRLFEETQRMMSLLEGFGDWLMDEAGASILPDVASMRERFEARRDRPRTGIDRFVARALGMDLKMAQYRRGERFIAGIAAAGGDAAVWRLWEGPERMPDEDEMDEPGRWVRRHMEEPAR